MIQDKISRDKEEEESMVDQLGDEPPEKTMFQ